jgi:NADH-quinone oxidoreductase subunit H
MGAVRAASQMVSYEVAMGLSIIALLMMTGTLSLERNCSNNQECIGMFFNPFPFYIFNLCICRNK